MQKNKEKGGFGRLCKEKGGFSRRYAPNNPQRLAGGILARRSREHPQTKRRNFSVSSFLFADIPAFSCGERGIRKMRSINRSSEAR